MKNAVEIRDRESEREREIYGKMRNSIIATVITLSAFTIDGARDCMLSTDLTLTRRRILGLSLLFQYRSLLSLIATFI